MIITAPVTDYIPASLMTTDGDMVSRRDGQPAREQPYGYGNVKQSRGAGVNLGNTLLVGVLDTYLKGQGGASPAIFEALSLRDTGIHIGNDTRTTSGNQVITGVGFQSSAIIMLGIDVVLTLANLSIGFSDGTVNMRISLNYEGLRCGIAYSNCIEILSTGSNYIRGVINTIAADGFTITWSQLGTTETNYIYICLP